MTQVSLVRYLAGVVTTMATKRAVAGQDGVTLIAQLNGFRTYRRFICIKYLDLEGNLYCGNRYKLQDENNPYKWEWAVCHALIETVDEQKISREQQKEMF